MSEVFGSAYANSYDLLYDDKDYEAECALIERVIREHGPKPTRTVLDLGCGTGSHAVPLARRGYDVVGVDRSEQMLEQARLKAASSGPIRLTLKSGDIRSTDMGRKTDAVLMMFAVLGYQIGNNDVMAALSTARRHLNPGGILIFDVWYGPAVLHLRPSDRSKIIETTEGQLVRFASGSLDISQQICTVNYKVWRIEKDRIVARVEESHRVRYFFPLEIDLLLDSAGFSRLRTGAFPEFDRGPDEATWNVLVVAKAV